MLYKSNIVQECKMIKNILQVTIVLPYIHAILHTEVIVIEIKKIFTLMISYN